MGNDGGSIPDRRDLVRNKPKAEQADKANQTRAKWFFCALSKSPLQEPIVSCALGKLYNKDSILEYLLNRAAYGDGEKICGHIRSLKDVKLLTLTPNPALRATSSGDSTDRPQFVCSLTQKEMNGAHTFVYISSCGCVFSQAGLKTVAGVSATSISRDKELTSQDADSAATGKQLAICPQCSTKFDEVDDLIILNPSPEEEAVLRAVMERRRRLEPAKKSKKRKHAANGDEPEPPTKKPLSNLPSTNPTIAVASRALTSSLAMEEAKRKSGMSEAVKSLYTSNASAKKETFMTMNTFTRYA